MKCGRWTYLFMKASGLFLPRNIIRNDEEKLNINWLLQGNVSSPPRDPGDLAFLLKEDQFLRNAWYLREAYRFREYDLSFQRSIVHVEATKTPNKNASPKNLLGILDHIFKICRKQREAKKEEDEKRSSMCRSFLLERRKHQKCIARFGYRNIITLPITQHQTTCPSLACGEHSCMIWEGGQTDSWAMLICFGKGMDLPSVKRSRLAPCGSNGRSWGKVKIWGMGQPYHTSSWWPRYSLCQYRQFIYAMGVFVCGRKFLLTFMYSNSSKKLAKVWVLLNISPLHRKHHIQWIKRSCRLHLVSTRGK